MSGERVGQYWRTFTVISHQSSVGVQAQDCSESALVQLSFVCRTYHRPKMIESLQGKHMKEIACGSGHSSAITTNGELYTWGQGDHGRLGHGDTAHQSKPKQVRPVSLVPSWPLKSVSEVLTNSFASGEGH